MTTMKPEVTSTVVSGAIVRRVLVALGLLGAEAAVVEGAPSWWWAPIAGLALWWAAVLFAEVMAARAAKDGVDDWQDLFWPRVLARLDRERFDRLVARTASPPTDGGAS